MKALGQQVGQIIAISYVKQNWTNKLFPILKVAPTQNYRQVRITAQAHDDAWYADTYGQDVPPKSRPKGPYGNLRPPRPMHGTFLFRPNEVTYDGREFRIRVVSETAVAGSDGTPQIRLLLAASGPPENTSELAASPLVNLQPSIFTTLGSLPGGITLHYAVAAVDADGCRSQPSWIVPAVIPSGTSTNRVQLNNISYDSNAASLVIYRGRTPQTMVGRAVALAASFIDDGSFFDWGELPGDPVYDHANGYWRRVLDVKVSPTKPDIFSTTTIGLSTASFPNLAGYTVEIINGAGEAQMRTIQSNTATALTVSPAWTTTPDATSTFVVYHLTLSATSNTIQAAVTVSFPSYANQVVRIVAGTERYQEHRIVSNTADTLTIEGTWAEMPDTTSVFEIVESTWSPAASSVGDDYSDLASSWQVVLMAPNEGDQLIEYTIVAADQNDFEAFDFLGGYSRYAIGGAMHNPILTDSGGQKKKMTLNVVAGAAEVTWTNVGPIF